MRIFLCMALLAGVLTACEQKSSNLNGRWTGPEGTYMDVRASDVAIRNLDGERVFPVQRNGNTITFIRDGVAETVHRGDGVATGMKWLADKKDCLIVKTGEGYCRD